jgi:hypothetical protein
MVQAKELSQWLTRRAKEVERGQRFNRLRSLLLRLLVRGRDRSQKGPDLIRPRDAAIMSGIRLPDDTEGRTRDRGAS